MSIDAKRRTRMPANKPPLLRAGDRVSRPEFHKLYELTPDGFRAELIDGVVYVKGRVTLTHGMQCPILLTLFGLYAEATPGIDALSRVTILMNDQTEPEPDLTLRIHSEFQGQSWVTDDDYLAGTPELLVEVADDSLGIDLGEKKNAYEAAGVHEYVVVSLPDRKLYWFDFRSKRNYKSDEQGIYRSRVLPGLWIDSVALLARRTRRLITVLDLGLGSPEHARFVERLKKQHARWLKQGKQP